jgi:hypothetical protein
MPREKKTTNCQHCGKEFTQARKDQKYCNSQCRFDHFLGNRETQEERLEALTKENLLPNRYLDYRLLDMNVTRSDRTLTMTQ